MTKGWDRFGTGLSQIRSFVGKMYFASFAWVLMCPLDVTVSFLMMLVFVRLRPSGDCCGHHQQLCAKYCEGEDFFGVQYGVEVRLYQ